MGFLLLTESMSLEEIPGLGLLPLSSIPSSELDGLPLLHVLTACFTLAKLLLLAGFLLSQDYQ